MVPSLVVRPVAIAGAAILVVLGGATLVRAEVTSPVPPPPGEALGVDHGSPVPAAAEGEIASGIVGARSDSGSGGGNPYRAIVARNAFRLKDPLPPPPPPTNPPVAPEPPKVDVKLSGLGFINGARWAYFVVPDPKRQGQFLYPALTDDPKNGDVRTESLEVREINLKTRTVRVVNGGQEVSLNFVANGVKAAAAPAAAGRPGTGVPAPSGSGVPGLSATRPATTVVVPATGNITPGPAAHEPAPNVFSRRGNRAANEGTASPAPTAGVSVPMPVATGAVGAGSTVNFPARPVRSEVASPSAVVPQIPIEHQYDILLRQRQAYDAAGIPLPPIPGLPAPNPTP